MVVKEMNGPYPVVADWAHAYSWRKISTKLKLRNQRFSVPAISTAR